MTSIGEAELRLLSRSGSYGGLESGGGGLEAGGCGGYTAGAGSGFDPALGELQPRTSTPQGVRRGGGALYLHVPSDLNLHLLGGLINCSID